MKDFKPQFITSVYVNGKLHKKWSSAKKFDWDKTKAVIEEMKSDHPGYVEILSSNDGQIELLCYLNQNQGISYCIKVVNQIFTGFVDKYGDKIYGCDYLSIYGNKWQIIPKWENNNKFYIRHDSGFMRWMDIDINSQEDLNDAVKIH